MTRETIEAVLEKFRPHFKGDGSDLLPQDMIAKVLDNEIRAIASDLLRVEVRMIKTY